MSCGYAGRHRHRLNSWQKKIARRRNELDERKKRFMFLSCFIDIKIFLMFKHLFWMMAFGLFIKFLLRSRT